MIREHEKSSLSGYSDLKNAKFTTVREISDVDICRYYLFHFRRCREKDRIWSVEKEVFNENLIHDDIHRNSLW